MMIGQKPEPLTTSWLYSGIQGLQKDQGNLENQDSIDTFWLVVPNSAN